MSQGIKRSGNTNCSVVDCYNSYNNTLGINFFSFPGRDYERERREQWIRKVNRKGPNGCLWQPSKWSRICSAHFVGNLKSNHPQSPSYNPTIFPDRYQKKNINETEKIERFKRALKRNPCKATLSPKREVVLMDSDAWQCSEGAGAGSSSSSTLVSVQTVMPVATATTGAYSEPEHVLEAIQQVHMEPELILKAEPCSDEEMSEYDPISPHREGVGGDFHRSESSVLTPSCVPNDSCASASTRPGFPALKVEQEASSPVRNMKRKRRDEYMERMNSVHERLLYSQVDIKCELTEIRKGVCKISESLEKLVKMFDKRVEK